MNAINGAPAPFNAHVFWQPITPQKALRALSMQRGRHSTEAGSGQRYQGGADIAGGSVNVLCQQCAGQIGVSF